MHDTLDESFSIAGDGAVWVHVVCQVSGVLPDVLQPEQKGTRPSSDVLFSPSLIAPMQFKTIQYAVAQVDHMKERAKVLVGTSFIWAMSLSSFSPIFLWCTAVHSLQSNFFIL